MCKPLSCPPAQSLAIFLVLGIGADDLFVMIDGWRQTELDVPQLPKEALEEWYHRRLAVAYSRTMQAVFNTSFTTAMAFISTAISPIMPISAFGIYATLCIIVNYILVITITPPAIILHQKYFGGFAKECCSGFCYCSKRLPRECCPCCTPALLEAAGGSSPGEGKAHRVSLEVTSDTDTLSKALIGAFEFEAASGPLKGFKVGALGSVLVCVAMSVWLGAWASTLDLPVEQEQW